VKSCILIYGIVVVLTWIILDAIFSSDPSFISTYEDGIRTPVFAAFFTLGSFLLTLKTALLQRLKEGFDSSKHKEAYERIVRKDSSAKYYNSLHNASFALSASVLLCFGSSLLQMVLGFVSAAWAVAICCALPLVTMLTVGLLWWQLSAAHSLWLDKIEEDRKSRSEE
jgi:uncharacterized ion transporter superfamily protein YfcC